MKPPCMLTQAAISAASPSGGARPRARAAMSPALQAAASGSASTCGRASRFAVTSERPIATVAMRGAPRSSRAALNPTISAAAAAAAPVDSTTPLHPPTRKASASKISDSHSCAVHGASDIEWLNGSARGAAPWAMIHSPVATCDQVSPSPSTWGEKAASVNRKIAIAARPSPASRVSDGSSLTERANGKAKDISSACQSRDNATLNRGRWLHDARHAIATRSCRHRPRTHSRFVASRV
jgi:hypothetical protein